MTLDLTDCHAAASADCLFLCQRIGGIAVFDQDALQFFGFAVECGIVEAAHPCGMSVREAAAAPVHIVVCDGNQLIAVFTGHERVDKHVVGVFRNIDLVSGNGVVLDLCKGQFCIKLTDCPVGFRDARQLIIGFIRTEQGIFASEDSVFCASLHRQRRNSAECHGCGGNCCEDAAFD